MHKIGKIGNPISTEKSPTSENIFIQGKETQIWIGKDSMRILNGLINFIEDLIARKNIYLKSILGFNWRKLESGGQLVILKS